jgi:hypothetical protein
MDNGFFVDMVHSNDFDEELEESVEQRFLRLYPGYDYSVNAKTGEKDIRRKKKMSTMY